MSEPFSKDRRRLLKGLALLGAGALSWPLIKHWFNVALPSGKMLGTPPQIAHQINHPHFPHPTNSTQQQIVIIGSGIAGLTCARHLYRSGLKDFTMLELESSFGGNSAWGSNSVSSFPIAAHYLPIVSNESTFLNEFLVEENIITHFDALGRPFYNELYLCHDLKERLYINGTWQEGLVPAHGITEADEAEFDRFFTLMDHYKSAIGQDGKPLFCIPIALSSRDPSALALDEISMAQFVERNGFHSPYLIWYLNYCSRDDYGAGITEISAWAGIHYFASRRTNAANASGDSLLTWPQGNGFLAQKLAKDFNSQIKTNALVYEVSPQSTGFLIKYFDPQSQQSFAIQAQCVMIAAPRFIAHKLCAHHFEDCFTDIDKYQYSPWLVANLTVDNLPNTPGASLAWDNVSYYSRSLGYIDANHQNLNATQTSRVLTYYLPLDESTPKQARQQALDKNLDNWKQQVIADLEQFQPGIKKHIQNIDVRVLGHAMIRPTPNQIWSRSQTQMKRQKDGLFFAHSDMSGISVFEEAFWQGLETAKLMVDYLR